MGQVTTWSPNGEQIAWRGYDEAFADASAVFVASADSSGDKELVIESRASSLPNPDPVYSHFPPHHLSWGGIAEPTPEPTPTPDPALCTGYALDSDGTNVRSGPSTSHNVLYQIGGDQAVVNEVQITGRYQGANITSPIDDWLKVSSSEGDGWASALWINLEGMCFPMDIYNEGGGATGGSWTPPTPAPFAPEAAELYAHTAELRLPGPFTDIPVALDEFTWSQGYGANTFSFQYQDYYNQTHGYHTGVDFGGEAYDDRACSSCINIHSICDGLVVSRAPNTLVGESIAIRCVREDGSLSNIILSYDHLNPLPNIPSVGGQVQNGDLLGSAYFPSVRPDWQPHLHFEIHYSVGFGNPETSLRLNPALLFAGEVQSTIEDVTNYYYPVHIGTRYPLVLGLNETPPFDDNDSDDLDYGILAVLNDNKDDVVNNVLNRWQPAGERRRSEDFTVICAGRRENLFWSRDDNQCDGVQNLNTEVAEWTDFTFHTISELVAVLPSP